tara:strand:+ start:11083 stop:11535 length:453 start_codon:yes stop_codon:yes gene_type:complete
MPNVLNSSSPRSRAVSLDQSNDSASNRQSCLSYSGLCPTRPRAVSLDQNNDSAPKEVVSFRPRSYSDPGTCPNKSYKRSKSLSPISDRSRSHLSYDPEINPVPLHSIEQDDHQLLYRKLDSPSRLEMIPNAPSKFPDPYREGPILPTLSS